MKFEIYKTNANTLRALSSGQDGWRWRLKATNGEPIASGESYVNKADCIAAVNLVMDTNRQTTFTEVAS